LAIDTWERRPVLRTGIEYRVLDDLSSMVVNGESGDAHALNPVGSAILERCDGTFTVHQIVLEITDIFDAPQERAEQDVVQFLGDLSARSMIDW